MIKAMTTIQSRGIEGLLHERTLTTKVANCVVLNGLRSVWDTPTGAGRSPGPVCSGMTLSGTATIELAFPVMDNHPSEREYPEEWELISFFGQDSDADDPEEAEFFGSSGFTIRLDDGDVLTFTLQRNFGALYLTLARDKTKEVNLVADDLRRVKIERLHDAETLLAVFGPEHGLHQVRLTLRPTLQLDWGSKFEG